MAQEFLPKRSISFAERLEMASMGTDAYNRKLYREAKMRKLHGNYARQLLQDAELNTSKTDTEECANELGVESPVRKKDIS